MNAKQPPSAPSKNNLPLLAKNLVRSVWFRLAILYMTIFSVSTLLVLVLVLYVGQRVLEDEIKARILAEVRYLSFEYQEDGLSELLEETEERIEKSVPETRLQYAIRSPTGEVVFDEIATPPTQTGWRTFKSNRGPATDQPFLFYSQPLDNGYVLSVGSNLKALSDFRSAIYHSIGFTLMAALVVSALVGLAFGGYISAKLNRLVTATQRIAKEEFRTRLSINSGGYEFERLAVELNGMFQKVEDLLNNLKHISSGLAHDMRTPLTVIKNRFKEIRLTPEAEPSLKRLATQAEKDIDAVLKHFESVLFISELDSGGLAASFETVNLSELTRFLAESYAPLLDDAGITADLIIDDDVYIKGDVSLLQRLIANLLDNTLLHAEAPGRLCIRLCVRSSVHGGTTYLTTENAATPQQLRANPHTSIHPVRQGMGLKIAQAVARLHGGHLRATHNNGKFQCEATFPSSQAGRLFS